MVDKIIKASDLPNQGAYTVVGTYDHHELLRLVTNLSKFTNIPVKDLETVYGKHLFQCLVSRYGSLISLKQSFFEFLNSVDNHIHVEVRKLYPEAELPRFKCTLVDENTLNMEYRSSRPFADLAEGLILGCADHFGEKIHLSKKSSKENEENVVQFCIQKEAP